MFLKEKRATRRQRILAMLLAFSLVLSGFTFGVFADDEPIPEETAVPAVTEEPAEEPAPAEEPVVTEEPEEEPAVVEEPAEEPAVVEEPEEEAPAPVPAADPTVDGATVTLTQDSYVYRGSAITPGLTVVAGGKTLRRNTDYTVAFSDNTDVGTATVTITGNGTYTGQTTKTFTITQRAISNATISGIKNKTYTGKAITQAPVLKYNGATLVKGTDYTLTYKNNKKVGTATVTITGKGNFKSTVKKTFKINSRTARNFTRSGMKIHVRTLAQLDNVLNKGYRPAVVNLTGHGSGIKLTWSRPSAASKMDGFIILRKNSKGVYSEIARVGNGTTSFIDYGVSADTLYMYSILGYKKAGSTIRVSPPSLWVAGVTGSSNKINVGATKLNKTSATLLKGQPLKLKVKWPANVCCHTVRWTSMNPSIATVDKSGVVRGRGTGTVKIQAKLATGRNIYATIRVINGTYKKTENGFWVISGGKRYYASPAGPVYTNRFFKVGNYYYWATGTGAVRTTPFTKYGYTLQPNSTTGAISEAQYQAMLKKKEENATPYILVDLSDQTMYVYKSGEVVYKSLCVTGKPKTPTVVGTFHVYLKARNQILRGPNEDGTEYEVPVSYWMPFYSGYGLHDLQRYAYGGNIYQYAGSHGCVNLPMSAASELWYKYVSVGTTVIVRP